MSRDDPGRTFAADLLNFRRSSVFFSYEFAAIIILRSHNLPTCSTRGILLNFAQSGDPAEKDVNMA